ncbi:MAG: hypothetical protein IPJ31_11915 [Bacteroidetes bacterium]|nr:hypothetical protein [Bacteroidota bacterium]
MALPVLSGAQPVVSPFYDTRATADVLSAAARLAGGKFAEALPYKDEVEFLQTKVGALLSEANGSFTAPDTATFMAYFQQYGGWLKNTDALVAPDGSGVFLNSNLKATDAEFAGESEFLLCSIRFNPCRSWREQALVTGTSRPHYHCHVESDRDEPRNRT